MAAAAAGAIVNAETLGAWAVALARLQRCFVATTYFNVSCINARARTHASVLRTPQRPVTAVEPVAHLSLGPHVLWKSP